MAYDIQCTACKTVVDIDAATHAEAEAAIETFAETACQACGETAIVLGGRGRGVADPRAED